MLRPIATLSVAAALLGIGGLAGAALSDSPKPAAAPIAAPVPESPVEVRTVVKRRTIHVYRKPKKRPAPVAAPVPAPAPAPAPAPVAAPAPAPVRTSAPLQTHTSGASRGGDDEHEVEHEEHEGGDD
jgi:outer membrane biosynthesis protein TonB